MTQNELRKEFEVEAGTTLYTPTLSYCRDYQKWLESRLLKVDKEWKEAINKCWQPTLCDGSDQLAPLSPRETIKVVHETIRAQNDAIEKVLIAQRETLQKRVAELEAL